MAEIIINFDESLNKEYLNKDANYRMVQIIKKHLVQMETEIREITDKMRPYCFAEVKSVVRTGHNPTNDFKAEIDITDYNRKPSTNVGIRCW